jgi:hypothetical protein
MRADWCNEHLVAFSRDESDQAFKLMSGDFGRRGLIRSFQSGDVSRLRLAHFVVAECLVQFREAQDPGETKWHSTVLSIGCWAR